MSRTPTPTLTLTPTPTLTPPRRALREDCLPGAHGGFSSRIYAGREAWTIVQSPATAAAPPAAGAGAPQAGAAQRVAGGGWAAALGEAAHPSVSHAWGLDAEARAGAVMMRAEPVTTLARLRLGLILVLALALTVTVTLTPTR